MFTLEIKTLIKINNLEKKTCKTKRDDNQT
jgi:hypothetical protein